MSALLRTLPRLLAVAALAVTLSTGSVLAAGSKHAPGPLVGTGIESILLLAGAAYLIARRSRRMGS